jgi:diguanylate cyclase (GGDEF)-like protein
MIEYRILFISAVCINLLLFMVAIVYWRALKTYPGWGLWIISNGLVAVIYLTIIFQGVVNADIMYFIDTSLMMFLVWIRFEAINRFYFHKEQIKVQLLILFTAISFLFFSIFFWQNVYLQIAILPLTMTYFLFKICRVCYFHATEISLSMTRFAFVVCSIFVLSLLYRAIDWFFYPSHHIMLTPVFANIQFSIVTIAMEISFTIILLVLNSQRLMKELTSLQKRLADLAATDPLTGLRNRRIIFELGEAEFDRARRYQQSLSVILFDFDNFKRVNDSLGHAAGDYVLKTISTACLEEVRQSEILGRLGGDEFVIILPQTEITGARATAERLRQKVKSMTLTYAGKAISMTISLGVAELSENETNFDVLLHQADLALYREKKIAHRVIDQAGSSSLALEYENGISF